MVVPESHGGTGWPLSPRGLREQVLEAKEHGAGGWGGVY